MKQNISLIKIFSMFSIILFVCSCAKDSADHKNKKLAENYYKLCMLEFSNKSEKTVLTEESYKKALMHIQQAINYSPCSEYLAVKATLLFRLNNFTGSCDAFEQALNHDCAPQIHSCILNNYACLLSQMGKTDKALQIFKELESDNAYLTPQAAIFNRGKILFDRADYKSASQEFAKAVQKAPDFLDARFYLAMTAFRLNDLSLAKNEVKTILFLEPEHQGAAWLKNKLESNSPNESGLIEV